MATAKPTAPDISGLLGQINAKRAEIPRAPMQRVVPIVPPAPEVPAEKIDSKKVKEFKSANSKTSKPSARDAGRDGGGERLVKGSGGRPSVKKPGIEYFKINPKVEMQLVKRARQAILDERFQRPDGTPIKTLEEIVSIALERLLPGPSKK
jgi:hypothetical protein